MKICKNIFLNILVIKQKKELEFELHAYPNLYDEIAKYRSYGIPKRYKNAVKKI